MPRTLTLALPDETATQALGARLAAACRPGDVIALEGDLGAGKSTLARALIRALAGAEIDVPSPTFTLLQTYDLPTLSVWHVDLYRLASPGETRELGLEEAVDSLLLLEWPQRLGADIPRARLQIELSFAGEGRIARLTDFSDWSERINDDWK